MTDLTKLSFNAVPASMTALDFAADKLGLSRTDTANRALQIYAALLAAPVGRGVLYDNADGTFSRLVVTHSDILGEAAA